MYYTFPALNQGSQDSFFLYHANKSRDIKPLTSWPLLSDTSTGTKCSCGALHPCLGQRGSHPPHLQGMEGLNDLGRDGEVKEEGKDMAGKGGGR